MPGPRTLADLADGCSACVSGVDDAVPPAQAARLAALGFRSGVRVARVRTAPLGDPVVYRVCDYEICLRTPQARGILLGA